MTGKKMKFPFLFKSPETTTTTTSAAVSWAWPSCATNPKTLSFRANTSDDIIHRTINSAHDLDDKNNTQIFSDHHRQYYHEEIISCKSEISMKGLRSERFFFEPGKTNSILEEAKSDISPHKKGVAIMEIDSRDPILDFRVSMEEMVEARGLKDWENLEKLLACYLRVNGKNNHGYIIGAFVDLLFSDESPCSSGGGGGAAAAIDENCSSSSTTIATQYSFTSPLSFSSSTYSSASACLSNSMENEDEIVMEKNGGFYSSSFLSNVSCSSGV